MIKLSVIGHLGHDALKKVINGKSVLSFSVAQNEQFKNLMGEVQERTTWINCSVWGRDNLAPYLRKGSLVYVEGRPAFKGYAGKQGEALAGVNLRVMELALLPGARGVLGTGRAGVEEENPEEIAEIEVLEGDGEKGEEDNNDEQGNGKKRNGKKRTGKKGAERNDGEIDEEVEDDGIRSDLPF